MLEIYFLPLIAQNSFCISTVTAQDSSGFKFSTISEERDTKCQRIPLTTGNCPKYKEDRQQQEMVFSMRVKFHLADLLLLIGAMGWCSNLNMKFRRTYWHFIPTCCCNQKSLSNSESHPGFCSAFPFTCCFVAVSKNIGPLKIHRVTRDEVASCYCGS